MAYGDSQYGNFQYQFGSLSPIIQAAMQRRQQAQAQSAQMGKVMGLIGAKYGEQSGSAGPGPSDVNNPGYYTQYAADANQVANPLSSVSTDTSGDLPASGYMRGGVVPRFPHRYQGGGVAGNIVPGMNPDEINEVMSADPRLWSDSTNERIGDYRERVLHQPAPTPVPTSTPTPTPAPRAVDNNDPTDLQGRDREGGPMTPQEMDALWQARQRYNAQHRATAMNEQNIAPQHYAGGGVANFGDPYPNENKYLEQFFHLPDVSAISHTIAQQREFQQQLAQQGMQDAYKQATQQMQTQQNNDAANAAMYGMQYPNDAASAYSDPGRVPDYGGVAGLAAQKSAGEINLDQAREYALGNKGSGSAAPGYSADSPQIYTDPASGEQFYRTGRGGWSHLRGGSGGNDTSDTPETQFDVQGREWRRTATGWTLIPKDQAGSTDQLPTYAPQTIQAPSTGLPSPQTAQPRQAPDASKNAPVNTPAQVNTPEDAANLPAGTVYQTPDGHLFRR